MATQAFWPVQGGVFPPAVGLASLYKSSSLAVTLGVGVAINRSTGLSRCAVPDRRQPGRPSVRSQRSAHPHHHLALSRVWEGCRAKMFCGTNGFTAAVLKQLDVEAELSPRKPSPSGCRDAVVSALRAGAVLRRVSQRCS